MTGPATLSRRHEPRRSILYVGQSYYHVWYLSRELRKLGWRADVLSWDPNPASSIYYHGEDFRFDYRGRSDLPRHLRFYLRAIRDYDIFHFSNAHGLNFGPVLKRFFDRWHEGADVKLLKTLGKRIVYSNNGCLDGVAQSSFASWGNEPVCDACAWRDVPSVCSDELNLAWGAFRNSVADYQTLAGGNRIDYNDDPRVHEVPEFACLDPSVWRPDLLIPANYRLAYASSTVKIYHAIGNFETRTQAETFRNIKSTHVYLPLIDRLKGEGLDVDMIFFTDVPNKQLRYFQAQADIIVDMLTYGYFGATVREGMMLGKPCVCYLRPEWLAQMRREIPEYVDELPIVSATPETACDVLRDLVRNEDKRREIGRRSREFAVKWHSAEAAARRFDHIYGELLAAG